jgi:flagellar hook assembly protein FlgD
VAGAGAPLTLHFALPAPTRVRVEVLDVGGRRVAVLLDAALAAGEHDARWDGSSAGGAQAPPGVYLVRLATGVGSRTGRVIVVR